MKMKSTYEKPSEKKKRIKTENLKRLKNNKNLEIDINLLNGRFMPQGKVKWFSAKGIWILSGEEEKDRDIFLHVSALEDSKLRVLKEDQILKFDIKEDKNKLQAINLKKI